MVLAWKKTSPNKARVHHHGVYLKRANQLSQNHWVVDFGRANSTAIIFWVRPLLPTWLANLNQTRSGFRSNSQTAGRSTWAMCADHLQSIVLGIAHQVFSPFISHLANISRMTVRYAPLALDRAIWVHKLYIYIYTVFNMLNHIGTHNISNI